MTTITTLKQQYMATLVQELAIFTLDMHVVQASRHFDVFSGVFRGVEFEMSFYDGKIGWIEPDLDKIAPHDVEAWYTDLDTICGIDSA